jgi:hypothetical protein
MPLRNASSQAGRHEVFGFHNAIRFAPGLPPYRPVRRKADETRHYSPGLFCNLFGTLKQKAYSGTGPRLEKYKQLERVFGASSEALRLRTPKNMRKTQRFLGRKKWQI